MKNNSKITKAIECRRKINWDCISSHESYQSFWLKNSPFPWCKHCTVPTRMRKASAWQTLIETYAQLSSTCQNAAVTDVSAISNNNAHSNCLGNKYINDDSRAASREFWNLKMKLLFPSLVCSRLSASKNSASRNYSAFRLFGLFFSCSVAFKVHTKDTKNRFTHVVMIIKML